MNMFCFQCQETEEGKGCTILGACGKSDEVANLIDLVIYNLKGIASVYETLRANNVDAFSRELSVYVTHALYATVTNVNFVPERHLALVHEGLRFKRTLLDKAKAASITIAGEAALWDAKTDDDCLRKSYLVGVLTTKDEDIRSLRETIIYGLKGIAAYVNHANVLGFYDTAIFDHMMQALAATVNEHSIDELMALVLATGKTMVDAMTILNKAHGSAFGTPLPNDIPIGVRGNPGILISGHDLKDIAALLEQTAESGVDVYTHSEMISAHYYPALRKYPHLAGNYGGAWWNQDIEFKSFNGPVIVTSNCITPVQDSYLKRIFTTGPAGYPGVERVPNKTGTDTPDFSAVIALAKTCPPPSPINTGTVPGGYAHAALPQYAEKIVGLIKEGKIRRFIVIAGCDGRDARRDYYTEVAKALPHDTMILTAGCAKYRFFKLDLGNIEGIPRIIEAGQCNDSFSLLSIALELQKVFGKSHINELPVSFDIPWYDQKAVGVLLALLYLGVKNVRLGPSFPAFLSPNIQQKIIDAYHLQRIGTPAGDVAAMMEGR
ncbi:MAG: hydroxylamine reductase [Spirochaetes bacterium]|nr:hydroxylamine reductase [Spirochaetota bacterium]